MRLVLLVWLVVVAASPVAAKPMSTRIDDLLKQSTTIVIAKLGAVAGKPHEATSYTLEVERALRGSVKQGRLVVQPSPDGHAYMPAGTRLLAFVNAKREWIAFGVAFAGPSLEDGVIRLAGFYDFNAHLVAPGVVTLPELERLIVQGTPMKWTFKGPVMVASKTGLVASKLELTVDVQTGTVKGHGKLGKPSSVSVGSWEGSDLMVTWQLDRRRFELEAEATGKNRDGSIAAQFRLREPGILTEADLLRFIDQPKLGEPYFELELDLGAQRLSVVLDRGSIGTIDKDEITFTSLSPTREIKTRNATVTLAGTYKAKSRGTTPALIEELITGPIKCTYAPTNGNTTPCTLRYRATKFAQ